MSDRIRFPFRDSITAKFAAHGRSPSSDAITLPFVNGQPPEVSAAVELANRILFLGEAPGEGAIVDADFWPGEIHLAKDDPVEPPAEGA